MSSGDEEREVINVSFHILHPKYDAITLDYDLMLLRLERDSKFPPVNLVGHDDEILSGMSSRVAGWGSTVENGNGSDVLRDISVNIVSKEKCSSDDMYGGEITKNMLCAAAPNKDTCQGDSGGPLVINKKDTTDPRYDSLVGIVSWGSGCANPKYSGVYASVQAMRMWVLEEGCRETEESRVSTPDPPLMLEDPGYAFDIGTARIVGGDIVSDPNRYTYQVAVYSRYGNAPVCGGSLIASNVVLCAAHCAKVSEKVRIGLHNVFQTGGTIEYGIIEKVSHPYYGHAKGYDFVLFKLDGHSSFQTVKIAEKTTYDELFSGQNLWVMGWGTMSYGGARSSLLKHAEVGFITKDRCIAAYGSTKINDSMMCAAAPGKDACQGDSGGPLVVLGKTAADDKLVGVVSWGIGCANTKYPGVYGNINHVREWVEETGCRMSGSDSILCAGPLTQAPAPAPIDYGPNSYRTMCELLDEVATAPPSIALTLSPSDAPSILHSNAPSLEPTSFPTRMPTSIPTQKPSSFPTQKPSSFPTQKPSNIPTQKPTNIPTQEPTSSPTQKPSNVPTSSPSAMPSLAPSVSPSMSHSNTPTSIPSDLPSSLPTISEKPSEVPTFVPTTTPTASPSEAPSSSLLPSNVPTVRPTSFHSTSPSNGPSLSTSPSEFPSASLLASNMPTVVPTVVPTFFHPSSPKNSSILSTSPSNSPSNNLTSSNPTISPTGEPSISTLPSNNPTSSNPTFAPTDGPSISTLPSNNPTSSNPTFAPTDRPSISTLPSNNPTSSNPTLAPTDGPSISISPSNNPNAKPSTKPTMKPSSCGCGDCLKAQKGRQGCQCESCQDIVCGKDPFCCGINYSHGYWDSICVNGATKWCGECDDCNETCTGSIERQYG
eukprot:CAMPEP_0195507180 /NCGR_PEP_ID=MMETSP0794_2-20130614/683_1 /TAXON_ID=515487 /ORGANISM="Stephanopyxis turris, Strain CCMP 815" /LENGTH=880 /DNA_ID=CAMNT_0040633777 /DNA_START=163 /DNA_END=2805 /DNA_ORIENTATION=-